MLERKKDWEMKKLNREIQTFLQVGDPVSIDGARKRQALEALRMERKNLRLVSRRSYGRRVLEQASYLSPLAWIVQGSFVLLLGGGLNLGIWDQRNILFVLIVCAPLMGVTGFTEILRSFRENVWELEQACRYNLRQLMGMRLLIFGSVDAFMIAIVFLSGIRVGIPMEQLLLFFLVPQLLSDCVYLYLMSRFRRRFQGAVLIGTAVVLTLLFLRIVEVIVTNPRLFQAVSKSAWAGALSLASGGLLAVCCMKFLQGINKEDEKWNFGWTV